MKDEKSNLGEGLRESGETAISLNDSQIAQLVLASSLSATRPLLGLTLFLVREGVLDGAKLKAFLEPMLNAESFPPETKAMLVPVWATFMAQIEGASERSLSNGESADGR